MENQSFKELGLIKVIVDCFSKFKFTIPSEIQFMAIPSCIQGKDLIIQAQAGTGKTLCYLSTVLQLALSQVHTQELERQLKIQEFQDTNVIQTVQNIAPFTIIIVPTRELALQVMDLITRFSQTIIESHSTDTKDKKLFFELLNEVLQPKLFIGGLPIEQDRDILRLKRCSIVIGTLGRIMQLLQENILTLHNIRLVILDEADKLYENQQFQGNFKKIMNAIIGRNNENLRPQVLTFSATYPEKQLALIKSVMQDPKIISTVEVIDNLSLPNLKQYYLMIEDSNQSKYTKKVECIIKILKSLEFKQAIVFYNDKNRGENLFNDLRAEGFKPIFIHGDQIQSDRIKVMHQMRRNKVNLIIATDLLSRGIDVDTLDIVIHFDIPNIVETYFHRIGRTGRFGTFGISLLLQESECKYEWVNEWPADVAEINSNFKLKYISNTKEKKEYFAQFLNGVSNWRDKEYQFYDESKFKYQQTEIDQAQGQALPEVLFKRFTKQKEKMGQVIKKQQPQSNTLQINHGNDTHASIQDILKCTGCKTFAQQLEKNLGLKLKLMDSFL